jgi:diadenylate cyclase
VGRTQVYEEICTEKREVDTRVLEQTVSLAVEIAREGREGRKIGTLFLVGDSGEVIKRSKPLILDPLLGHPDASISRQTRAVAVVVSESSMVRMFDDGELVSEIVPELWMIDGYTSRMEGRIFTRRDEDVTVIGRAE